MPSEKLTFKKVAHWIKQIEEDQVKWVEAQSPPKEKLEAYRLGISEGARQMFNTLRLQGYLKDYTGDDPQ